MTSIRTVLGLAASLDLEIEQMDVKTAFLHGYKKTSSDRCVFVKSFSDDDFIILLLYVDDMLIVGKNASRIDVLKKQLCKSFAMKDLGHAKQILGMGITRIKDERKLYLSQEKYIERVLERFNMKNAKVVNTPFAGHMKLSRKMCPTTKEEKESIAKVPHSSVVRSLMYAMVCTRPDIAHAVGVVNRCLENSGKEYWEAVKWILRYLRGILGDCLCFGVSDPILKGYRDAGTLGDYLCFGVSDPILKGYIDADISKLQKCVALSTTEAEYIAATEAGKEMIWLKRFLQEHGLQQMEYVIYCDSQSAIDLSKNSMYHARTNHIDVRYHWIREQVENESFYVEKIHTIGGVVASVLVVLCLYWAGLVDHVGFESKGTVLNLPTFPVSIGLYGFCYSGHAVFPNIYTSLADRSQFPAVLLTSFGMVTLLYGGTAVLGYLMFGDSAESQFTLNMPKGLMASKVAVWTTMVSFPTRCAPSLYKILHELSISIYHAGLVMALIGSLLTMLVVGHFTLSLSLFSVAICYSYHKSVLMEALFPDSDTTLCLLHENLEGKNKRPSGYSMCPHYHNRCYICSDRVLFSSLQYHPQHELNFGNTECSIRCFRA
ncbi:Retrovirus-related Pol polyprotein from transposon TNT 1-94 [Capsicum annuum]|nr:Retrovirus-related Pol polyprotein from transposon TNT 1-94 [Capsicum annuum]